MNQFVSTFLYTIIAYATPIIFCSLGGQMTAMSGKFNLGMEGMMLFSAFFSLYFTKMFNSLALGMLLGVSITALLGLFMALMCIKLKVDIYIVGLAINTLGTGLTTFLIFLLTGSQASIIYTDVPKLLNISVPLVDSVPYLNRILSGHNALDFFAILLCVIMNFVIFRTAFGRRVRAVGLNEWTANSRGIPVNKMIYISYALCGAFCGLAGASLSLPQGICVAGLIGMTNGRGWLAMAIVILTKSNPYAVLFSSWALGAMSAIGDILQTTGNFSARLVQMLPFVGAILASSIYSYRRYRRESL
ncbi:MAG: ABC transporter permease [Bacillota bacterium]